MRRARQAIPEEWDDKAKFINYYSYFTVTGALHCDADNYFYARNLYLPYILEEREGMPVSLGALTLFGYKFKLPIYPVNFPTQIRFYAQK